MTGRYIALEGPDAAGKSSLHKALKKKISTPDHEDMFVFVREPYYRESITLLKIAKHPFAKLGIFVQDRVRLMEEIIIPAIKVGKTVVSDRSYVSMEVYQYLQMSNQYGLNIGDIELKSFLRSIRMPEMPPLNFIILLTAGVGETIRRLEKRKEEIPDKDWLKKLRSTYIEYVSNQGCGYLMLDTGFMSKEEIIEEAWDVLFPPMRR